jgi:hypothetical protein
MANLLLSLDNPLKPKYFNDNEGIDKKQLIEKTKDFQVFLSKNQIGFFLYSNLCCYNFSIYEELEFSDIFIDFKKNNFSEQYVLDIFKILNNYVYFGFACDPKEYDHRNRIYADFGKTKVEAWVGRNLTHYIPGVYWRTLLSYEALKRHNVDLSSFPQDSIDTSFSEDHILLKMFENPNKWQKHKKIIDKYCSQTSGIFAIDDVRQLTDKAHDYFSLDKILRNWP